MSHLNISRPGPGLACALALASAAAAAQPAAPADAPALAVACQACHGTNGISGNDQIPNLAGQKAGYLAAQLRAFRSGARKHDLMTPVAMALPEADILPLAAWWSTRDRSAAAAPVHPTPSQMPFPADFPAGFLLYETVEDEANANVLHRYANRVAWQAARAGQPLPAGSVILVANHPVAVDPATGKPQRTAQGKLHAGPASSYAGMQLREGWGAALPPLLRNGDWHYGLFNAERQPRPATHQASCLACHLPRAADSYVFTLPALRASAAARKE